MKISILFELDIGEAERCRTQLDAVMALLTDPGAFEAPANSAAMVVAPPSPPTPVTPRRHPARLPFEEFDQMVRSELQRLACDGRIPGFSVWDTNRDPRLPTMSGVLQRYNIRRAAELASLVGLLPPLGVRRANHAR